MVEYTPLERGGSEGCLQLNIHFHPLLLDGVFSDALPGRGRRAVCVSHGPAVSRPRSPGAALDGVILDGTGSERAAVVRRAHSMSAGQGCRTRLDCPTVADARLQLMTGPAGGAPMRYARFSRRRPPRRWCLPAPARSENGSHLAYPPEHGFRPVEVSRFLRLGGTMETHCLPRAY